MWLDAPVTISVDVDAIARDLGYADAADLKAKADAERAKLSPGGRAVYDEMHRRVERAFLFGDAA